ncbi:MAG: hypothetical protein OP8BY_2266 [Candidatus Saccharicenans subterraneus]|uniref:Outer membrane protein beta-barrel domain-containing protein n=1 Tax=Candidatus Saccharicenans subterraneus TaxID=2508984 RepID=A0A3E2BMB8_9BACT|nr:MAG: hypothetical protein OP8BY_2266 [Candidatus Saccharicenans subterraneum]
MELKRMTRRKGTGIKITLAVWLLVMCCLGARATVSGIEARLSLLSGLFNFRQAEFREIYGQLPLFGLSLDLYTKSNLGLEAGIFRYSGRGETITLEGEPAVYPVKFYRWCFPLLLKYRLKTGRFQVSAGAGPAFSVYDESWVGVDLSYHGQKVHFRVELAAEILLTRKIYLRAGLTWDSIATGARSLLLGGDPVRLDGLSLGGGLGYVF